MQNAICVLLVEALKQGDEAKSEECANKQHQQTKRDVAHHVFHQKKTLIVIVEKLLFGDRFPFHSSDFGSSGS